MTDAQPARPARKLAVVTCMDARIDPTRILGLEVGDAHVIRNAGALVTDEEIRSLAVSQRLLGTEEVALIGHTDCGMLDFDDHGFKRGLEDEAGEKPAWRGEGFSDLEEGVRRGVERIRSSPFVPHRNRVRGYVYEVESGRLRELE